MKIDLQRVYYMPNELRPDILYVSEEFGIAIHLCACGCGSRIRTPLGPTDWTLTLTKDGPTLYPSIGKWQHSCRSHYWIHRGKIIWARKWSANEIAEGHEAQKERDRTYYSLDRKQSGIWHHLQRWLKRK